MIGTVAKPVTIIIGCRAAGQLASASLASGGGAFGALAPMP